VRFRILSIAQAQPQHSVDIERGHDHSKIVSQIALSEKSAAAASFHHHETKTTKQRMMFSTCPMPAIMKVAVVLVAFVSRTGVVDAHGFVTISRNQMCKDNLNSNCGLIVFEPQSLEAVKGYPNSGPPDGKLASAGLVRFTELDQQSTTRWRKTTVSRGSFSFTWRFTANHATTGYQYYMTRNGWNANAPLSRAQFDSTPFCSVDGGGSRPPIGGVTHTCTLPDRSGYHVILAVWTISDAVNAFYNAIDVQFGGSSPTAPVPAPTGGGTGGGTCGNGSRGNGICSNGQCCSQFGWCGTTSAHCSGGGGGSPVAAPVAAPAPTAGGGGGSGNVCSSGKALAAVDRCRAFVYCVGGAVLPNSQTSCPAGTLFSNAALVCDWPSNVACSN
jgi:predicted carbohydrate-binding protein with CBM5 and CBM33 domain